MKIILTDDLEGKGVAGDVIEVKGGFARNYLFPRNLAIPANKNNLKHLSEIKAEKKKRESVQIERMRGLAEAISNLTVTIYKKVGEDGRIFGQVTSGEIKDVLFKEKIEIDRKAIELPEQGIKSLGEYEVTVRVHPEIKTRLKVQVSPEGTE